jgi:hypothetical protein
MNGERKVLTRKMTYTKHDVSILKAAFVDWSIVSAPIRFLEFYGPKDPRREHETMELAGKVLKTVVKARTTTRATARDGALFGKMHRLALEVHDTESLKWDDILEDSNIAGLQQLLAFLQEKSGKTTNRSKIQGLYEQLPTYMEMRYATEKLSLAMDRFKVLIQDAIDEKYLGEDDKYDYTTLVMDVSEALVRKTTRAEMQRASASSGGDVEMSS